MTEPITPADAEPTTVDFVLHGAIDRDEKSLDDLWKWLAGCPAGTLLRSMEIDGEQIDLQGFETQIDRFMTVKFTRNEG